MENAKYECTVCDPKMLFCTIEKLQAHTKNKHSRMPTHLNCEICNKLLDRHSIKLHMKSIHGIEAKPLEAVPLVRYECTICDPKMLFCTIEKFNAHKNHWHAKMKTHKKCKICNELLHRNYVKLHMKTVHQGAKDFCCELCGKSYTNNTSLQDHIRAQHEKKWEYKCSKCDKAYNTKRTLKQHFNAIHLGQKHQCAKCGKVCTYYHDLRKHDIVAHQKIKKYKCDQCGKDFFYVHSLNIHVRTAHEGKMLGHCQICNKKFTQKTHLRRHIDLVHKKMRPYLCNDCGETFTKKIYLRNHEIKKHGKTA